MIQTTALQPHIKNTGIFEILDNGYQLGKVSFTVYEDSLHEWIEINNINIWSDYNKRKGYGSELLKSVENYARQNSIKLIKLCALTGAFEFYIKNNYKNIPGTKWFEKTVR